jgi:hypothetical protein
MSGGAENVCAHNVGFGSKITWWQGRRLWHRAGLLEKIQETFFCLLNGLAGNDNNQSGAHVARVTIEAEVAFKKSSSPFNTIAVEKKDVPGQKSGRINFDVA